MVNLKSPLSPREIAGDGSDMNRSLQITEDNTFLQTENETRLSEI